MTETPENKCETEFILIMNKLGWDIKDFRDVGYGIPDFKATAPNGFVAWVEAKGKGKLSTPQKKAFRSGAFGDVVVLRSGNMSYGIGKLLLMSLNFGHLTRKEENS